jgi:hypothetical protein
VPRRAKNPDVRKKKAGQATVRQRVEEILRIRLNGAEFWDVREYVREKEQEASSSWALKKGESPMCDKQIQRYIRAAEKLIAESARETRPQRLDMHLAKRRNLYAKAVLGGDYRTALAILRDEAELLDLYPNPEAELRSELDKVRADLAATRREMEGRRNDPLADLDDDQDDDVDDDLYDPEEDDDQDDDGEGGEG